MARENQQNKENSKQRILTSATKLFAQKGYDAVGIREICKDANVNICMISYFWGGKEELYKGIINNLIEKQTQYVSQFIDLADDPINLSKEKQISLLYTLVEGVIEWIYGDSISNDLFRFLIQVQQSRKVEISSPAFVYIRKLLGAIFNKDYNDRDIIYKTVFIVSQVTSPKIFPAFSLLLLKQETFMQEDKSIIKTNLKVYVKALLKEAGID